MGTCHRGQILENDERARAWQLTLNLIVGPNISEQINKAYLTFSSIVSSVGRINAYCYNNPDSYASITLSIPPGWSKSPCIMFSFLYSLELRSLDSLSELSERSDRTEMLTIVSPNFLHQIILATLSTTFRPPPRFIL